MALLASAMLSFMLCKLLGENKWPWHKPNLSISTNPFQFTKYGFWYLTFSVFNVFKNFHFETSS